MVSVCAEAAKNGSHNSAASSGHRTGLNFKRIRIYIFIMETRGKPSPGRVKNAGEKFRRSSRDADDIKLPAVRGRRAVGSNQIPAAVANASDDQRPVGERHGQIGRAKNRK